MPRHKTINENFGGKFQMKEAKNWEGAFELKLIFLENKRAKNRSDGALIFQKIGTI